MTETESVPVVEPAPPRLPAKKIGFIGVPGAGKSTVAQATQVEMGSHSCITAVCPEYAREFITKHGQPEHIALQQGILFKQMRREDTLAQGCDVLFCDSPVFLCHIYGLLMLNPLSKQQAKISRNLYMWAVLDQLQRYDIVFYLPKQFEVISDSIRVPEFTQVIEDAITGFLSAHKHLFPNFHEIRSELEDPQEILHDRVKQIKKITRDHIKKSDALVTP